MPARSGALLCLVASNPPTGNTAGRLTGYCPMCRMPSTSLQSSHTQTKKQSSMRFFIDLMAVTGFMLSTSMTAGLIISYYQMDDIMRNTLERVTDGIGDEIEKKLQDKIDKAMPGGSVKPSIY